MGSKQVGMLALDEQIHIQVAHSDQRLNQFWPLNKINEELIVGYGVSLKNVKNWKFIESSYDFTESHKMGLYIDQSTVELKWGLYSIKGSANRSDALWHIAPLFEKEGANVRRPLFK